MFDIGFWELLVIGVVLLLVMGPERLPEVAKQAAFLVRKARQGMFRLRSEMQSEIGEDSFADLKKARQEMLDFKNDIKQYGHELADSVEPIKNAVGKKTEAPTKVDSNAISTKKPASKKQAKKVISKKKLSKKVSKKVSKKAGNKVGKKANKVTGSDEKPGPKTNPSGDDG